MLHAAKPPEPGPVVCMEYICKPSYPDPRIAHIPPDAPSPSLMRHVWLVRMTYWGGREWRRVGR